MGSLCWVIRPMIACWSCSGKHPTWWRCHCVDTASPPRTGETPGVTECCLFKLLDGELEPLSIRSPVHNVYRAGRSSGPVHPRSQRRCGAVLQRKPQLRGHYHYRPPPPTPARKTVAANASTPGLAANGTTKAATVASRRLRPLGRATSVQRPPTPKRPPLPGLRRQRRKPPCDCEYPSYCGSEVGECTYTFCVENPAPPTIECTTTTTVDPEATTTTPAVIDCTTTTTLDAETCGGCDWVWTPLGWELTGGGCTPVATCDGGYNCGPCPMPAPLTLTQCGTTAHTDCTSYHPPPPPPPAPCQGQHQFIWSSFHAQWVWFGGGCSCASCQICGEVGCNGAALYSSCGANCSAPAPSTPGTSNCQVVTVPCRSTCPDCGGSGGGTNPCATTTTTLTTTSTADPCGTGCNFSVSEEAWVLDSNGCSPGCSCSEPPFPPVENCQTAHTSCYGGTTTTSPPTTTTTSPPTTTTLPPTTTTTTPEPWWCIGGAGYDCSPSVATCQQHTLEIAVELDLCDGPYDSEALCSASCSPTTTTPAPTTTTTPAPQYYCMDTGAGCTCIDQQFGRGLLQRSLQLAHGLRSDSLQYHHHDDLRSRGYLHVQLRDALRWQHRFFVGASKLQWRPQNVSAM